MSVMVCFDTTVLIYAYDNRELKKQHLARSLITSAMQSQVAVISAQVLREFYVVVTRKISNPMSPQDANKIVEQLGGAIVVAPNRAALSPGTHEGGRAKTWSSNQKSRGWWRVLKPTVGRSEMPREPC